MVDAVRGEANALGPEELLVEEPLEIRLDGLTVATTMRTPGNDFELAAGFCLSEGYLADNPISGIRYCGTGPAAETEFNVVSVETAGRVVPEHVRLGTISSACGVCGSTVIEELVERIQPLASVVPFKPDVLAQAASKMGELQELYAVTGSAHAAAALDVTGRAVVVREDIGRHNAVDKVVGKLLLEGQLPATEFALFASGRASFDILIKAWAAGFSSVVAVSAPSSLAVETAKRAGIGLVGFARGERYNVYN
jgi:FdhD protein